MTKYVDNKRVVARAITFIGKKILLIERYHKEGNQMLHYFTIPGGGVEDNETYEVTAIRETKEETCCDIEIVKYLGEEDYGTGICHWFYAKYLKGEPTLGGEEKEKNNPNNHFEVVLIDINQIDKINILGLGKKLIKECLQEYQK